MTPDAETGALTRTGPVAAPRSAGRGLDAYHTFALVGVVLLLTSVGLALGALFYEAEYGSHAGLSGWEVTFAITVDGLGFLLASVLSAQVMLGYRLFSVRAGRFRATHIALGWTVVALVTAHGVGAVIHTFQGTVELLPVWLDIMGGVIVVLLGVQIAAGYLMHRSRTVRGVHDWLAIAFVLFVALHGFLGYYHVLTG